MHPQLNCVLFAGVSVKGAVISALDAKNLSADERSKAVGEIAATLHDTLEVKRGGPRHFRFQLLILVPLPT